MPKIANMAWTKYFEALPRTPRPSLRRRGSGARDSPWVLTRALSVGSVPKSRKDRRARESQQTSSYSGEIGPHLKNYLKRLEGQQGHLRDGGRGANVDRSVRSRADPLKVEFYRHKDRFILQMKECEDGDWRRARKILDNAVSRHQETMDRYLQRERPFSEEEDFATRFAGVSEFDEVHEEGPENDVTGTRNDPHHDDFSMVWPPESEAPSITLDNQTTINGDMQWDTSAVRHNHEGQEEEWVGYGGFESEGGRVMDLEEISGAPQTSIEAVQNRGFVDDWGSDSSVSGGASSLVNAQSEAPLTRQQLAMQIAAGLGGQGINADGREVNTAKEKRGNKAKKKAPQDWVCQVCHMKNYEAESECFGCHAPRQSPSTATIQPGVNDGTKSLSQDAGLDDWECPKCGHSNFAWRKSCISCEQQPEIPQPKSKLPDPGWMTKIMEKVHSMDARQDEQELHGQAGVIEDTTGSDSLKDKAEVTDPFVNTESAPYGENLSALSVSTVDGDMFAAAIKVFKKAGNLEQAMLSLNMMEECAYSENVARSFEYQQNQIAQRASSGHEVEQGLLSSTSMGNLLKAYAAVVAMCANQMPFASCNSVMEIIFERMPSVVPKHRHNLLGEDVAVSPDLDTLNSALLALARAEGGSRMDEIEEIVDLMKSLKIKPNILTLNYLILGCANYCGDGSLSWTSERMDDKNELESTVDYAANADSFESGQAQRTKDLFEHPFYQRGSETLYQRSPQADLTRARKWFESIVGNLGVRPKVLTFNLLLQCAAFQKDGSDLPAARQIIQTMSKYKVKPNDHTYASALDVCTRRSEGPGFRSAEEFKELFEGKHGLSPGPKTYRSLINFFDTAGKVKTVDNLYREAQRKGIDLGVGTGQHEGVLDSTILKRTAVKLASVLQRGERTGGGKE